jgi:glycolate oxidase iron-sulfur subunit
MEAADRCCGGGGEYQIEYGEMSALITDRKVENVLKTGARFVATGCPGCNITIGAHLARHNVKTIHTVQLIQTAIEGRQPE